MLYTINSKFKAIVLLLVFVFLAGYGILALFLHQQKQSDLIIKNATLFERQLSRLDNLFREARFWETIILSQKNPKPFADFRFGEVVKEIRDLLQEMEQMSKDDTTKRKFREITNNINAYENEFNELIQLKNKQSLLSTQMETSYRSMVSVILNNNESSLLKPLFNLNHFLLAYRSSRDLNKYNALKIVITSLRKKLDNLHKIDIRTKGYLRSFEQQLDNDYNTDKIIQSRDAQVDKINTSIEEHFETISLNSKKLMKDKFQETVNIRDNLNIIFLLSAILGTCVLVAILMVISKNIITPIRSIATVMKEIKEGMVGVRYEKQSNREDEIIQFGLSFNEMLDRLELNNQQLIEYQKELEQKIQELSKQEVERKRMETQLHQAQKMEAIGNLAGGIAHDFNNILSSIIGFTELSMDDIEEGSVIEDNLQEIFKAGKRARDLVKQILAFARQSEEEVKPIQVDVIVKEVLKFIRSSIPTTIEIRQDIKSNSLILGNAIQVHQLLMNLVTNASHAMEDTGGVLFISLKDTVIGIDEQQIDLGSNNQDCIEIKVTDTGKGIPPEIIDSIFEPYFTTKGLGEGTGMGLAMVHGIVKSYGGDISVKSSVNEGTEFTIYLPITKKREFKERIGSEPLPTGTETIMLVDDEASIVKMESQILERLGYTVITRTSSIEALELFRSRPEDFQLIITDMTMPNMTGDELAVELMKIKPDIPVILCTGYSKKISDETASIIGIRAFAYKPIVKADLAKTVRDLLDEAKIEAQQQ